MGRWRYSSRRTVEDCRVIASSFLRKCGYFNGSKSGIISWTNYAGEVVSSIGIEVSTNGEFNPSLSLRLSYFRTNGETGERTDFDYRIRLVTTACNYGGKRYWFYCPFINCGRRVGKLYLPPGAKYYGCRHCYRLTYESCRLSHSWMYNLAKAGGLTLGQFSKSIR